MNEYYTEDLETFDVETEAGITESQDISSRISRFSFLASVCQNNTLFTLLAQDFNPWKRFVLTLTLQPGNKQIPPFKEKNALWACRHFTKTEPKVRKGKNGYFSPF